MLFDEAFSKLIGNEGGYVNDPKDPGGETKYGISKRSYPGEDIANLTLDRAKEIYKRDFWAPVGCDAVPDELKFDLFDTAVNSGVQAALKLLQRACGEHDDGVLGPLTLQAVQSVPAARLRARFAGHRLHLMTGLPTWERFGRGWAHRVAIGLMEV